MLWLIEKEEQLPKFKDKEAFIEIIPYNDKIHPSLNKISLVFIYLFSKNKGFLSCHSHPEARSFAISNLINYIQTIDTIYVRNKKRFLHYFDLDNVKDLSFIKEIEVDFIPNNIILNKFKDWENANHFISLSKHYERCCLLTQKVKELLNGRRQEIIEYNDKSSKLFKEIEKTGIKIDKEKFNKFFTPDKDFYSIKDDKIYTQYNLYTLTKRPSNSFNGINFSALNKDNGCRESFIPQNDYFWEVDISAYHPTLISQLIKYDFNGEGIYEHFSKLFNTDYNTAKKLLLFQLYGGIKEKYKDLEYFKKTQQFIDKIWNKFINDGYYETHSGVKFYENNLENMNPNKLFNYVLQELETYNNLFIIEKILDLLKDKKTKLVLYTYDSFTFDVSEEEVEVIGRIEKIFDEKKLKIKLKKGLFL